MTNVFNRTIGITLYEVDVAADGSVIKREPEEKLEFNVTPITLEAIDSIEQWARQQVLDKTIEALRANTKLTKNEFLLLVAAESRRLSEVGWNREELNLILQTKEAAACIVLHCLTGVSLTIGRMQELMQAKENQQEAWKTIRRLDTLDLWGVSHPFKAQSPGRAKTTTSKTNLLANYPLLDFLQKHTLKDS